MHSWTKKQKTEVFRLAKSGTTYSEIAKQFNVSIGAVAAQISLLRQEKQKLKLSRLRKKVNMLRKNGGSIDLSTISVKKIVDGKWKNKHRNLALRLWKKGAKYEEIANLLGVTIGSVSGQISILRNADKKKTKTTRIRKIKKAVDVQKAVDGGTQASIFDVTTVDIPKPKRGRPRKSPEAVKQKKIGRPSKSSKLEVTEELKPSVDSVILENSIPWKLIPRVIKTSIKRNLRLLSKIEDRLRIPKKKFGKVTSRHIAKFKSEDERICQKLTELFPKQVPEAVSVEDTGKQSGKQFSLLSQKIGRDNLLSLDSVDQIIDEIFDKLISLSDEIKKIKK